MIIIENRLTKVMTVCNVWFVLILINISCLYIVGCGFTGRAA